LNDVFAEPFRTRWIFDVEILARLIAAAPSSGAESIRTTVYEYPLEKWDDVRGSRLKASAFLKAALDLAGIHWRYMRHNRRKTATVLSRPAKLPEVRDDRRVA
jgi:hypothetical protein